MRSLYLGSLVLALGLACGGVQPPEPAGAPLAMAPPVEAAAPAPNRAARPPKEGTTRFEGWVEPNNWDETDMFGLTTSDHGVVWLWCKDMATCRPLAEHGHSPGEENWMYAIDARKTTKADRAGREMSASTWLVLSMKADDASLEAGSN